MANGQQLAAANLERFESWSAECEASGDWADYTHQGQLNRTEVAAECGFAKSVLRQNSAVKAALETLEARLRAFQLAREKNRRRLKMRWPRCR